MSDTADHLEREVEARRASVESTLDALKDRMSVNQVIDEVGQFIGVEDARAALHTAGRQVRENPVALGMIGLGLAWLVLGNSGKDRRTGYDGYTGRSGSYEPYSGGSRDWREERSGRGVIDKVVGAVSGAAESVGHAASAAGEKISSTLGGARDRASHYADDIGERSGSMRDSAYDRAAHLREDMGARGDSLRHRAGDFRNAAADRADDLRHRASDFRHAAADRAGHMRDQVSTTLEQQPLLIGGVAVVVGAVIGAALPRTRTEDRMMGQYRDDLMDEARAASAGLRDRAMDAAHHTYDAAVDAARDEGLVPEKGETVAAKLERVAGAAVQEAKDQVDPVLHGEKDEAGKSEMGKSGADKPEAAKTGFAAQDAGKTKV